MRRPWLRFSAGCRAVLFAQDLVYTLPFSVLAPFIEIIVYLLPGRKSVRHHPPGNATTEQIEASLDDATHVIVRLLPPFLAFREEPCDEGPFLIFEVRRISFAFHGSSLPSWQSPIPFQQLTKSDVTPMVLFDFGIIFAGQPLRGRYNHCGNPLTAAPLSQSSREFAGTRAMAP